MIGMAANVYSLRSADKICESLITLRPRDIYQVLALLAIIIE